MKLSPSTTNTPSAIMSATKNTLPSGEMRMSCGIPRVDSLQIAEHFAVDQIDLDQPAVELAGEDREPAVDREIGVVDAGALRRRDRILRRHRMRVAKVEPLVAPRRRRWPSLPSGVKYRL